MQLARARASITCRSCVFAGANESNAKNSQRSHFQRISRLTEEGAPDSSNVMSTEGEWQQLNIPLVQSSGCQHDAVTQILSTADELVAAGLVQRFFFMRKPPGLRLRLLPTPRRAALVEERVLVALDGLRQARMVGHSFASCYEPETFMFGGSAAVQSIHSLFHADSVGWWRGEHLRLAGRARLNPVLLSVAMLNHLFFATLGDTCDVKKAWCNLAWLHLPHTQRARTGPDLASIAPESTVRLATLTPHLGDAERALVESYERANDAFASELESIAQAGLLLRPKTHILPFIALFHFNRYDFSATQRRQVFDGTPDGARVAYPHARVDSSP